jgi:hypothetical protein
VLPLVPRLRRRVDLAGYAAAPSSTWANAHFTCQRLDLDALAD